MTGLSDLGDFACLKGIFIACLVIALDLPM